jgi:hypothetical protein
MVHYRRTACGPVLVAIKRLMSYCSSPLAIAKSRHEARHIHSQGHLHFGTILPDMPPLLWVAPYSTVQHTPTPADVVSKRSVYPDGFGRKRERLGPIGDLCVRQMAQPLGQPNIFWFAVVQSLLMAKHSDYRAHTPHGQAAVAAKSSINSPGCSDPIIFEPIIDTAHAIRAEYTFICQPCFDFEYHCSYCPSGRPAATQPAGALFRRSID